jgi:G3E family GTPase
MKDSKTKLILIGGFLGAGKTTLLGELASRLGKEGLPVGLITNDQASELVDSALLEKTGCATVEVSGSCFCCNFAGLLGAVESLISRGAAYIIAEPVGSCTDLSATIMQPLKEKAQNIDLAPLTVAAEPKLLAAILAGESGGLHPSAAYIVKKQLEEADYILVNKADILGEGEIKKLRLETERAFPQAKVYALSALFGSGVDEWFNAVLNDPGAGKTIAGVDYDVYAEGEARMGWLNATVRLREKTQSGAWRDFLDQLLAGLGKRIRGLDAAVGHVKGIVQNSGGASGPAGGGFVIGSVTSHPGMPAVRGEASFPEAQLILNVRAEMKPRPLEDLTLQVIRETCGGRVDYTVSVLKCFSPGRPQPSYRYAKPVSAGG